MLIRLKKLFTPFWIVRRLAKLFNLESVRRPVVLPELSLFLEVNGKGKLIFTEFKKRNKSIDVFSEGLLMRKKAVKGVKDGGEVTFWGYEFF